MNVHNPDQYMASLRQIIAQGRKRIGLIVGAGAPAGMKKPGSGNTLIPAVAELTDIVTKALKEPYGQCLALVVKEIQKTDIESILSRVRSLGAVIGNAKVHGLDGKGFAALGATICDQIGKIVNQDLPDGASPYTELVSWITGTDRPHPVEIFTTNYDLLFEQAFERARAPFFDGFSGASEPFFDPSSIANNDLPPRWSRLWKLHGSIGWKSNSKNEVIRTGERNATHLVFPEHLKYDHTQKAPYSALLDRLRSFLSLPDTLLISTGFSYSDAHISARIDECLAANPGASVFAFQFKDLSQETFATDVALRRANMSVFARDQAVINGIAAPWQPGVMPTRDWAPIRATYWTSSNDTRPGSFDLGRFDRLARFFASSRSSQHSFDPMPSNETRQPETP